VLATSPLADELLGSRGVMLPACRRISDESEALRVENEKLRAELMAAAGRIRELVAIVRHLDPSRLADMVGDEP
jgi:hypothetical protein